MEPYQCAEAAIQLWAGWLVAGRQPHDSQPDLHAGRARQGPPGRQGHCSLPKGLAVSSIALMEGFLKASLVWKCLARYERFVASACMRRAQSAPEQWSMAGPVATFTFKDGMEAGNHHLNHTSI